MIKLVLATMNRGKIREMKTILEKYNVDILSSLDFPRLPPVEEDGSTFRENAVKKALSVYRHTGLLSLADDSGLEIDALDGRPGIRSSRFAGPDGDDKKNIGKVLTLMRDIPEQNRQARFRCVMAFVDADGDIATVEGTCEGRISFEPRGSSGFGYDPIFIVPRYDQTIAQLGEEIKNRISHRARALDAARTLLEQKLSTS